MGLINWLAAAPKQDAAWRWERREREAEEEAGSIQELPTGYQKRALKQAAPSEGSLQGEV